MNKVTRRGFVERMGLGLGAAATLPSLVSRLETASEHYVGKKLNVALCGLGRYANVLKQGVAASHYCHLAGVVTGTPSKAIQWKKDYNLSDKNMYTYQSFDQIKNNPDIDLVYITLPNGMHKEFTIRAAQAGKHVIVEKPMAFTEKDCQEMIDACKAAKVG